MLLSLCDYPDSEIRPLTLHVFRLSDDNAELDDAIRCYVHGKPGKEDHQALEDSRRILQLSEENPLHFFCGKLHIRVMRILGIEKHDLRYLFYWYANFAVIISAWKEVFARIEPAFSEET